MLRTIKVYRFKSLLARRGYALLTFLFLNYDQFLTQRKSQGLERLLHGKQRTAAISLNCSDYLGLSMHPFLHKAASLATKRWGSSGLSSRLLLRSIPLYQVLEDHIARSLGAQKCLMFGSGYQANVSVISSLLDTKVLKSKPLVFCDRFVHASIYQGFKLAGVRPIRFGHQNLAQLEECLAPFKDSSQPKFIFAETIYSMEGTRTDIQALNLLAEKYGALLYLDEAHALGVCGRSGYGLGQKHANPAHTLFMGTFSKGLGASGGFVAGPGLLIDYLINACNGFIYTTAPPPGVMASALAGWRLSARLEKERQNVQALSLYLWQGLQEKGFKISASPSHIIPLYLKTPQAALEAQSVLRSCGIDVSAIRAPTVPLKQPRLRFCIHAHLTHLDIERIVEVVCSKLWPIAQRDMSV